MSKQLMATAPRVLEFVDVDDRAPRENEVVIATIASAISQGTELRRFRGAMPKGTWDPDLRVYLRQPNLGRWPMTLGYESVGIVVEIGSKVTELDVGALVWTGSPHREISVVNEAEAARGLLQIQSSDAAAVDRFLFLVRTTVALGAIHDAAVLLGERVVVVGAGVIGLIAVQLALLSGAAEVYAVDISPRRLQLAKELGATPIDASAVDAGREIKALSGHGGADVAIEVSGTYQGLHEAIRSCCVGGRVVAVGSYSGGASALNLGEEWHRNRITMLSSMTVNECPARSHPLWDLQRLDQIAKMLLGTGKLKLDGFISHRYHFCSAPEAFRMLDSSPGCALQVVLHYDFGRWKEISRA